MAAFKFRLAKIRDLKQRAEEEAAQALGKLLSQRLIDLKRLSGMNRDKRMLLELRDELQMGKVEPARLSQNRYQVGVLENAIVSSQAQLQELDRRISQAQAVLQERSRERKLFDKLEEKRREEHALEERRREQKEMDDLPRKLHGTVIAMETTLKPRG